MRAPRLGLLFPGQGSQGVGMGRELHDAESRARDIWSRAADVLGYDLARIAFEGPEPELRRTDHAQPALLTASLATLALMAPGFEGAEVAVAAGHSLGEYTALVAAGALEFEDALRLVARRGESMWRAGVERPGAMAALLGMTFEEVEAATRAARGAGVVVAANHNAPRQVVISGDVEAVEAAMAAARERGAKRAVRLEVSGAFHSPLMAGAAEGLAAALEAAPFARAHPPVVANVDGAAHQEPGELRDALVRQLTAPVRWVASMESMVARGVDLFVEVGPGRVLSGLARQIAPGAETVNVEDAASLARCRERIRSLETAGERT